MVAARAHVRRAERPTTGRGDATDAMWIFCRDESRRRRGCDVEIQRRRVARLRYDVGPEAMAFDVDVKWASATAVDLEVYPTGTRGVVVPVVVRNVKFQGTLRVIMAPLVPDGPGYGALLVSLRDTPKIGLDVRVAGGEITRARRRAENFVRGPVAGTVLHSITSHGSPDT